MNKRHWFFDLVALVIIGAIILYAYLGGNLSTSILRSASPQGQKSTVEDCAKLSQDAANGCYLEIAIQKKDASVCDKITKSSERKSCQREVELTP